MIEIVPKKKVDYVELAELSGELNIIHYTSFFQFKFSAEEADLIGDAAFILLDVEDLSDETKFVAWALRRQFTNVS